MVSLERPKLRPYVDLMRKRISDIMGVDISKISIKATTFEGLGIVGEGKAIICEAICLIENELIFL
jgi:2-C-methyl-D-erythritol 2,4-cyclodiphosphate synthase